MKKTIIAAALIAMTACNKSLIEVPQVHYGFIDFGIAADTEMAVTKAFNTMASEQLAGYNVTLKQGESVKWSKEYSEIDPTTDLKQPAGTYTLYVENLTDAEATPESAKGQVRVAGTKDFTLRAGITESVVVECSAVNSMVTVDKNFTDGVFTSAIATIKGANREFQMGWGHNTDNAVYYPAMTSISWELAVTLADNSTKTYVMPSDRTITTSPKSWTQINFTNSNTDGTIEVTIMVDNEIKDKIEITEEIDPLGGNSTK